MRRQENPYVAFQEVQPHSAEREFAQPMMERKMNGKEKSGKTWALPELPETFEAFSMPAMLEMQRRNMEAISKSAARMAEAFNAALGKQVEMASSWSKLPALKPLNESGNAGERLSGQMKAGREAVESTIANLRDLTDEARQCWYEVAEEFGAVAKEIIGNMEEQFKKPKASANRPKPVSQPLATKDAAE